MSNLWIRFLDKRSWKWPRAEEERREIQTTNLQDGASDGHKTGTDGVYSFPFPTLSVRNFESRLGATFDEGQQTNNKFQFWSWWLSSEIWGQIEANPKLSPSSDYCVGNLPMANFWVVKMGLNFGSLSISNLRDGFAHPVLRRRDEGEEGEEEEK